MSFVLAFLFYGMQHLSLESDDSGIRVRPVFNSIKTGASLHGLNGGFIGFIKYILNKTVLSDCLVNSKMQFFS